MTENSINMYQISLHARQNHQKQGSKKKTESQVSVKDYRLPIRKKGSKHFFAKKNYGGGL